MELSAE